MSQPLLSITPLSTLPSRSCRRSGWLVVLMLCVAPAPAQERALVLLVQPIQGEAATKQSFQPLADYLSKATGVAITVAAKPNFFAHWDAVRRDAGYDLVLDDAHFTDYRVQKFGFHVLAKLPGTMSYSLAVAADRRIVDPLELAGKLVACFGPPSIAATRLSALFSNPARRPAIVDITGASEGLDLLLQGKVAAAMLPTSAVADLAARGRLRILTTTEPTLQMALSASPRMHPPLEEKIRAALIGTSDAKIGEADVPIGVARFEPANAAMYANQSRLLKQYWGY